MMQIASDLNQIGITIDYQELTQDPSVVNWWALLEEKEKR